MKNLERLTRPCTDCRLETLFRLSLLAEAAVVQVGPVMLDFISEELEVQQGKAVVHRIVVTIISLECIQVEVAEVQDMEVVEEAAVVR